MLCGNLKLKTSSGMHAPLVGATLPAAGIAMRYPNSGGSQCWVQHRAACWTCMRICAALRTSFFFFPGSAAGAAALKSGDAVRWWLLSIALATRGRAGAADPPLKSFSLLGFSRFWGFGVGEKRVKFADAFWRSLLGVFWSVFGQFFIIFWYCPRVKIV